MVVFLPNPKLTGIIKRKRLHKLGPSRETFFFEKEFEDEEIAVFCDNSSTYRCRNDGICTERYETTCSEKSTEGNEDPRIRDN